MANIIRKNPQGSKKLEDNLDRANNIPLVLSVVFAQRQMALDETLKLQPGFILQFEKSIAEPFEILIEDVKIAEGYAIKSKERFGIRISSMRWQK
jgi:flagellar motor switch protein FliN/FliY